MKYRILALLDRVTFHKLWPICGRCWDHEQQGDPFGEMTDEDWDALLLWVSSQKHQSAITQEFANFTTEIDATGTTLTEDMIRNAMRSNRG